MNRDSLNRVFMLVIFAFITVFLGIFALTLTEGGASVHGSTSFQVMDVAFEVISAFATVGLSTGLTPELTTPGKLISCLLMFIGRLGPIWLITTLQQFQKDVHYRVPDMDLPVG